MPLPLPSLAPASARAPEALAVITRVVKVSDSPPSPSPGWVVSPPSGLVTSMTGLSSSSESAGPVTVPQHSMPTWLQSSTVHRPFSSFSCRHRPHLSHRPSAAAAAVSSSTWSQFTSSSPPGWEA